MNTKLFASNIDFDLTEEALKEMVGSVGEYVSVVLARDKESGRSRGFAFIEMSTPELAAAVVEKLDETPINGRPMKVCEDRGKNTGSGGRSGGNQEGQQRPEHLPPIKPLALFRRRKKLDPFMLDPTKSIDYKDVSLLNRFVSEGGKILGRKSTGLNAYNQRQVARAVKRAQHLGLMPFSSK